MSGCLFDRMLQADPWSQEFHAESMPYLWTIVIDLAIFLILYKNRRRWVILHAIIGFGVTMITVVTSFPILAIQGVPTQENADYQQRHIIIGVIIISILFAQVLMGFATSILKFLSLSSPFIIYSLNTAHKYTGYTLLLLAKIQVYLILSLDPDLSDLFWGLLGTEMILFTGFILRKLFFPITLNQAIMPDYQKKTIRPVTSIQQMKIGQKALGMFANYIYNLSKLQRFHPCGYKIIENIKYRDFDRYLYGMYRTERDPSVPTNKHSLNVLDLLGEPVAKLSIPSIFKNLDRDYCDVILSQITCISEKGQIYLVEFESEDMMPFEYRGYSKVEQLGRFYSLTLNKKITRLYTSVGFLHQRNIQLMNNIFSQKHINIMPRNPKVVYSSLISDESSSSKNSLTLMMKKYEKGQLTKSLIDENNDNSSFQLSCARGQGLHFGQLQSGRIIIVAGGTGLLPFCDLIDLLYKTVLLRTRPELVDILIANDPVLKDNPFASFTFNVYLAVGNMEDVHPLTWAQLNELTNYPKILNLVQRVSNRSGQMQTPIMNNNVTFTKERFSAILSRILPEEKDKQIINEPFTAGRIGSNKMNDNPAETYKRIWVCGPPPMTQELVKMFDTFSIPPQHYLIV